MRLHRRTVDHPDPGRVSAGDKGGEDELLAPALAPAVRAVEHFRVRSVFRRQGPPPAAFARPVEDTAYHPPTVHGTGTTSRATPRGLFGSSGAMIAHSRPSGRTAPSQGSTPSGASNHRVYRAASFMSAEPRPPRARSPSTVPALRAPPDRPLQPPAPRQRRPLAAAAAG